ncbi:MAG TPA: class E sortase [Acidimicrobiales bacterium]|nr:class E sortase [Acidimicrobiales bacterium]
MAPSVEREPLGRVRRAVRELGLALITLGVVVLLLVVYELFGTNLTADRHQAALGRAFRAATATATATATTGATPAATAPTTSSTTAPSTGGAPAAVDNPAVDLPSAPAGGGGVIDHLVIPRIGVDRYVVDGTTADDLTEGPGHYLGTPYPGQPGDVAIAGHRTTYGAPFYRLGALRPGDDIYLTDTSDRTYDYRVDGPALVVAPSDVAVIGPTPDATLTLTTCNPPLSATSRLVVKARLIGSPVAPPTPAPTPPAATGTTHPVAAVPPPNLTGGSSSAWAPTIGWGSVAVVAWIATRLGIARLRRWRRAGATVVTLAVCAAALWFTFAGVVRLLPQSI